jgi:serine/threonine protein kinase
MIPERWDDLDRVWHAVLARPESERAAAIDELCPEDQTLRRDIESLLAHLARASAAGFGAAAVGMAGTRESLIGRQLDHYAVHTLLGAGGMGDVFQATDSTLDRQVALKILPDLWLADPDRQARFDREARVLASLNHPNIGSIYGVHDSGSVRALILELVDGETLAARLASRAGMLLARRGLPIADVVTIAPQIVDALEAAHARGIVHRDLKPANIKITPRPQSHAVQLVGDLDAVLESNMVRRTGAICIVVDTRADFGGHTNVDILDNDIDEGHPIARVAAIKVGSPSVALLSPKQPITATGVVNIIGNTIRNSSESCLNNAIAYDVYAGRIERNRIVDFVQACATATPRNMPSAIWLGLRVTGIPVPPVTPTVRFNDIHGNAHAGLRVAPNQAIPTDASCNYWGSEQGPSGIGHGSGDSILVEPGVPAPVFTPFATAPVARSGKAGC